MLLWRICRSQIVSGVTGFSRQGLASSRALRFREVHSSSALRRIGCPAGGSTAVAAWHQMCPRNGHDGIRRVGVGSARLTHSRALQAARRFGALMEVIKAHGLILGGVLVVDLERSELLQLRRPLASNWRPEAVGIVDLKEEDRAVEVVGCPRVEVVVGAPEARTLMSKPLGS